MEKKKKIFPIKFEFINTSHWGDIHILPEIIINVTYSMPTIILQWWVFRLDIIIYKHFPNWFMKYIWNTLNFDFSYLKKDKDTEDE